MKKKTEKNIHNSRVLERPVRKSANFPTRLIIRNKTYDGFVVNISARGIGMFINTAFNASILHGRNGTILTLEVQSAFGDIITLECIIRRLRIQKCSENDIITTIGMEVIDPPPNFIAMFESLC